MLRRRTHPRSKNGCSTCKGRHVRCDERRPYCRNCVRLGRECRFPANPSPFVMVNPGGSSGSSESQLDYTLTNWPKGYTIYCGAPHHQALPSTALVILQESQSFSTARPMPRSFWVNITKNYTPNYNLLAVYHDCVKHSLVSFAAYTHYQGSKRPLAQELCISYCTLALQELQNEIVNFSSFNADAIISSSIFLAGTAQNWEQWGVFIDGYSKVLSQIMNSKFNTVFPELLSERFQLRRYFSSTDSSSSRYRLLPQDDPPAITLKVESVIDNIVNASNVAGLDKWRAMGFEDLGTLAQVVKNSLFLPEPERFHRLSFLRTWMFWLDLRQLKYGADENLLTALFYVLLLALVPIFPERYRISLRYVCLDRIKANLDFIVRESIWADEAAFLTSILSQENETEGEEGVL